VGLEQAWVALDARAGSSTSIWVSWFFSIRIGALMKLRNSNCVTIWTATSH
jgi:hypothetical protein